MPTRPRHRKHVALVLAGAIVGLSCPAPGARAELVTTDRVIEDAAIAPRDRVAAFLARDDVRMRLEALGIAPAEAQGRVDSLSDAEVRRISGKIDSLPAGQGTVGTVVGAAVIIFVVLLITDILGLTNVFSFTRDTSARGN